MPIGGGFRPPTQPINYGTGGGGGIIIPGGGGGGGGGGNVVLKEGGNFAAGGGVGRNSLLGRSQQKYMPFLRRRRGDQLRGGTPQEYPTNPYRDIEHFQDYTPNFLLGQPKIAAQQHLMATQDPYAGYPSHDKVQAMSRALDMFSGRGFGRPRGGGPGLDVGDPMDQLRKLLHDRLYGGDQYGG